jgi:hypothetical protein
MNKKILVISIVVLIVVGAAVYYFSYKFGYQTGLKIGGAACETSLGKAVENPLEKMPSANPFEAVKNPFKDLYKNPFK